MASSGSAYLGFSAKNFATAAGISGCCCGGSACCGGCCGCCCCWASCSALSISASRDFKAVLAATSAGDSVVGCSGGFASATGGSSAAVISGGVVTGGSSWRGPASTMWVEYFFLSEAITSPALAPSIARMQRYRFWYPSHWHLVLRSASAFSHPGQNELHKIAGRVAREGLPACRVPASKRSVAVSLQGRCGQDCWRSCAVAACTPTRPLRHSRHAGPHAQ